MRHLARCASRRAVKWTERDSPVANFLRSSSCCPFQLLQASRAKIQRLRTSERFRLRSAQKLAPTRFPPFTHGPLFFSLPSRLTVPSSLRSLSAFSAPLSLPFRGTMAFLSSPLFAAKASLAARVHALGCSTTSLTSPLAARALAASSLSLFSVSPRRHFSVHSHNIRPDKHELPASEVPLYYNRFDQADHPSLWQLEEEQQRKHLDQEVTDVSQLVEPVSSPHQTEGWFKRLRYWHYKETAEPTFPRTPDLSKGELAAGATVTRTSVWHDPNEPAIVSVSRFAPDNFRAVGFAENVPNPESTNSDSHPDFREYRLGPGSVDRRPFVYFMSASYFFITASMMRSFLCKWVHYWWVSRDMLAAGTTEVDLRPIQEGMTAVFKWRGKPVFVRHRTAEDIAKAQADDALIGTMKDPQLDSERCPRPQWLINIGVCTHLGCIPTDGGNYGGWFCPCHGSHYDTSGRIRLGPAPSNLELPPTVFLDDHTVKLG
ncbi:putative ubiquinol cytochrome c oxidoreductase [Toxoplasma gondii TgCatPRC2]|uniref:Ubiquinol cytochrome c oxidoreductase, putative n=4 Tax=Toxoplasma gondii TaxID=5811 RepID=A0A125YZC1_TOXGM|nr:ubiquinol cytochrome c oxidoreductase, putative [Toxoplasma gondii ME49]EPR58097.1 putative ubiquinol cytochrome c oxidoreductase [Toxoplasma gondii GT1]EPT31570.1 ubiquinol cytochrome c oxidoreductase, putative [Toxoplasma gondii ME49]KAF4644875.1 putative ubiquinol cytochrome c oxidoreductase [Toxoplasma gondii]KYK66791.1 putative ubiquinol cytochrome c oxidoreductase [Toxoplasma gondii TgCatPRC2]|eukprot:XP_002369889.1 ubiquinol cytochrome c oxidoreductase, putative [Toxoplasma gondii ME49]